MESLRIFLKEYWRRITLFIVVLLGFTVLVQIFKESPLPAYIPWYEKTATYFFDWFNDWAIHFSNLATLFLALVAFQSIWENRVLQKERIAHEEQQNTEDRKTENKRHALQEIHDWAEEGLRLINPDERRSATNSATQMKTSEAFEAIILKGFSAESAAENRRRHGEGIG